MDQHRPRQHSIYWRLLAALCAIALLIVALVVGLIVASQTELDREFTVMVATLANLAILALTGWISFVIVRALRELTSTIDEVTEAVNRGEGDRRVRRLAARELDDLGQSVNQMLDSLSANAAEAQLQRQRTAAIVDSASEGIVVVDGQGRVTNINPAAARMFETTIDHARGQPAADLGFFGDDELGELIGLPQRGAVRPVVRLRGDRVLSAAVATLQGDDGETSPGLVWVLRDVTELAQIDEMKSEFISVVSHELRTPLTAIKGFTDLILEGEVGEISDQQREFLMIVQSNSDRLVGLINDMLDVARIESGRITLNPDEVDVPLAVEQAISALRPLIEDKQIQVQTELVETSPTIIADPARLQQILTNLIANACKYTQPGGWVTVRSETLEGQIAISVSDTGIGIDPDALSLVFSKFYRVNQPSASDSSGSGLGLPITKSLVELHGGKIAIASRVGVGTTVRFTLATAGPNGASSGTLADDPNQTGAVLLVVSADAIRRDWEAALRTIPADIVIARGTSAAAAAGEAELHRPSVMVVGPADDGSLLDIHELLDELQGSDDLRMIPLIVVGAETLERHPWSDVVLLPEAATAIDVAEAVRGFLPAHATERQRRGRVLVAEDDTDTAHWIRRLLVRNGFEVVLVRDGLAAIVRAIEILPDAVVLDANMPRMGAREVLPQLMSNPGTREIPVIVISGTLPEAGPYFIEAGAVDFFSKPFNGDLLVHRLVQLNRRRLRG